MYLIQKRLSSELVQCALLHTHTARHHGCNEVLNNIAGANWGQRHSCISHGSNVEHNALRS